MLAKYRENPRKTAFTQSKTRAGQSHPTLYPYWEWPKANLGLMQNLFTKIVCACSRRKYFGWFFTRLTTSKCLRLNKSMTLKVLVQRFKRVATRLLKSHRWAIHSLRSTHLSSFGFRLVDSVHLSHSFKFPDQLLAFLMGCAGLFAKKNNPNNFVPNLLDWFVVCAHVRLNANRLRCHSFREMAACLGEKEVFALRIFRSRKSRTLVSRNGADFGEKGKQKEYVSGCKRWKHGCSFFPLACKNYMFLLFVQCFYSLW